MKKAISILLIAVLTLFCLVACAPAETTTLNVGYMTGPTGMGMAKLISDNGGLEGNEKYTFTSFDDTKMAMTKLINGEVDVICYPTNDAANFVNTNETDITVLAINTLGTLFLVNNSNHTINSIDDLNGKTIYTCKNGTPRLILEKIISEYGVDATVSYTVNETEMATPKDLAGQIIKGNVDIAVAPEPIVSNVLTKKADFHISLNMAELWENKFGSKLPMGCILAKKDFVKNNASTIKAFLNEYKESIDYISDPVNLASASQMITDAKIVSPIEVSSSALGNLRSSITFISGSEMKTVLQAFYNIIGIASPDNEFYYAG